jgi:predicted secreted acid phosphatase
MMKNVQIITNTLFAVSCALIISTKSFAEPANLGQLKATLITYQSSGEYDKEVASVIAKAKAYIDDMASQNQKSSKPLKLAIVLDIDDTSLSNYPNISASNFCQNQDEIDKAISSANDPVIAPTLALYNDALNHHIAVFFVTGRRDNMNKATVKNLKDTGFANWSGLYFRPKGDQQPSVIPYKTQARTQIEEAGYTIIASIGDQDSDLAGGHAAKTFKLPNPFYYLP